MIDRRGFVSAVVGLLGFIFGWKRKSGASQVPCGGFVVPDEFHEAIECGRADGIVRGYFTPLRLDDFNAAIEELDARLGKPPEPIHLCIEPITAKGTIDPFLGASDEMEALKREAFFRAIAEMRSVKCQG